MRKQSASSQRQVSKQSEPKVPGFLAAFDQLVGPSQMDKAVCYDKSPRGRPATLTVATLIKALVFHMILGAGSLAEHLGLLSEGKMSGSSISERRQALPWEVFDRILEWALKSVAQEDKHPQAFYRGLRRVAIDGTQFSLQNTAQILKQCTKATARRLKAAFAKLNAVVMLEIGLHNPLAAAIDQARSEWALALELVAKLPAKSLLLADRLYGCARFAQGLLEQCQKVGSYFLVRARQQLKSTITQKLSDGSALVRIPLRAESDKSKIVGYLTLREFWVTVERPGFRSQRLRLWTNLLEEKAYPALELAALYARRWEHELYYRQMKLELRRSELLQSQTVETAAQEVAALVLATAMIARERAAAANGECAADRISFVKVVQLLQPLWLVLSLGEDILSQEQKQQLIQRFYAQMRAMVSGKRRSRSCPRVVRQPVRGWPRKTKNVSHEGEVTYKIK
jgi:Transposase DDE domain